MFIYEVTEFSGNTFIIPLPYLLESLLREINFLSISTNYSKEVVRPYFSHLNPDTISLLAQKALVLIDYTTNNINLITRQSTTPQVVYTL